MQSAASCRCAVHLRFIVKYQLVRALACHARGRGFKSHPGRQKTVPVRAVFSFADIAQSVECILGKDEVTSSNLVISSKGNAPLDSNKLMKLEDRVGLFYVPKTLQPSGSAQKVWWYCPKLRRRLSAPAPILATADVPAVLRELQGKKSCFRWIYQGNKTFYCFARLLERIYAVSGFLPLCSSSSLHRQIIVDF